MARKSASRRARVVALVVWFGVAAAVGEQPVPTPSYGVSILVNLVNVDVVVTGPGGVPVTNLGREDFAVFEDDQPVEITNFAAPSSAPSVPGPMVASGTVTGGEPPGDSSPLSLVVVLDDENLSPRTRRTVLSRLHEGLEPLLASGRVRAMLATGAASLRVNQPFTTNPDSFLAALTLAQTDVVARSGGAFEDAAAARTVEARASFSQGRPGTRELSIADAELLRHEAQMAAKASFERARASLLATAAFLDSLAGVPGRKVLFLVSEGIPVRPGEAVLRRWQARFGQSNVASHLMAELEVAGYSLTPILEELVARANASRIAVYCIDAGLEADAGEQVAEQGAKPANPAITADRKMSARFALEMLATGTGGRSLPTSSDLVSGLAAAVDDAAGAFSLAFAAPHPPDGKLHAIRVEVRRPGVHVRHRESYLDKTSDDRMADRSMAALLHNVTSNPLGVQLTSGTEFPKGDGTWVVPVLVNIPIGSLTLVPEGEVHVAHVAIWLAARDVSDRLHQATKQVFTIRVPNQRLLTALTQSAGTSFQVVMRPGRQRLAASLRDEVGGGEGTATAELDVAASAGARAEPP